jgi:hypothetical protein
VAINCPIPFGISPSLSIIEILKFCVIVIV